MTETAKIKIYAQNLEQTKQIATELAHIVNAGTIILLNGDLGAGKTTFMQFFGIALGITTNITSPTFTLIDEYTDGRLPLYHIDLYRLESSQVNSLHLSEYWHGVDFPLGIVAIEWASKLPSLPPSYLEIDLRSPTYQDQDDLQSSNISDDIKSDEESAEIAEILENLVEDRWLDFTAHGTSYRDILTTLASKIAQSYT